MGASQQPGTQAPAPDPYPNKIDVHQLSSQKEGSIVLKAVKTPERLEGKVIISQNNANKLDVFPGALVGWEDPLTRSTGSARIKISQVDDQRILLDENTYGIVLTIRQNMERTGEDSEHWAGSVFYTIQLATLLLALVFVALTVGSKALTVLLVLLLFATAVGFLRRKTVRGGGTHLGTDGDITYDPIADPGQAAKDDWKKAVRQLPDGDDEQD